MSTKRSFKAVSISLLILACAVFAAAAGFAKEKGDDKGEGGHVTFTKEHPRGDVRPDKALVYVVRPAKLGFAIKSYFLCDDEILGINKGGSYFFAYVDPGRHVFWSKSENVDAVELEVEAGKTYYIQQQVRPGGLKARTRLKVLTEAEGEAALAKCGRNATMTDKGREKGEEIAREHKDATQKDLDRRAKKAKG
ncbi:MAG: DUF2846 domain-containing protein [Acidobacteria bacterium]|nr:MAG: DUF2846 domain-containing protein [Acidobacteriota bacterium]